MNYNTWRTRRGTRFACFLLFLLVIGSCQSATEPGPTPVLIRPPTAPEVDPLDETVARSEKTMLETLWELEKAVRDRDRRIVALEEQLARAHSELEQLKK